MFRMQSWQNFKIDVYLRFLQWFQAVNSLAVVQGSKHISEMAASIRMCDTLLESSLKSQIWGRNSGAISTQRACPTAQFVPLV